MRNAEPYGRYDQGFFNTACQLVNEIVPRNYLHFLAELDASGMDRFRQTAKRAGKTATKWCALLAVKSTPLRSVAPKPNNVLSGRPLRFLQRLAAARRLRGPRTFP